MKQLAFFLVLASLSFWSCNKCDDSTACNYGLEEDCKYSTDQESLLVGSWNLIDIHDLYGECIFSMSSDYDCELDQTFDWINLIFNNDKTCQVLTSPSEFSDPVPMGDWSINICENALIFFNPSSSGYHEHINEQIFPFGTQDIVELTSDDLFFRDAFNNLLHWEKI